MMIRKTATILALLMLGSAMPLSAQQGIEEIPFEAVKFGKMPKDLYMGEASGVAVNSKGHVFVVSRGNTSGPAYAAAADELYEFDSQGNFVREIGHKLYAWGFAHGVSVDRHDNIWIADKGTDMVVEFNPEGEVILVLGRKAEAADESAKPWDRSISPPLPAQAGRFRQVTGVAFDSKDNAYISDGYVNSRVGVVNKDGDWMASYGTFGKEPGQFNTVHGIANDAQDRIYVADRSNRRIQVLDTAGKVVRIITMDVPFPKDTKMVMGDQPGPNGVPAGSLLAPGAPWTVCVTPPNAKGVQYLYASDAYPGRIYKMTLEGKMLGYVGMGGRTIGKFGWIHGLACPDENTVYAAELLNWRVQKITMKPKASQQ